MLSSNDDPKQPGASATGPAPAASADANPSTESSPSWVGTWAVAPQKSETTFEKRTLRQIVRTSVAGTSVRVRISNQFGDQPLAVQNVRIAWPTGDDGRIDTSSDQQLTFDGAQETTVAAGSTVTSDPIDFEVPALSNLAVSFYLPQATGPSTQHHLANRTNFVATGDQSDAAALSDARNTTSYSFLTGVEVQNPAAAGAVVAIGASITDGFASTYGANKRWPDLLAKRLADSGRNVGVLNAGISGNELTKDGSDQSALNRFDRDVLAQPGVRWVIFSDNPLNDLGDSNPPTETALLDALRQLIERSHAAGIKFVCSTLTPFQGAGYWSQSGEHARAALNAFVRSADSGCDGVIDQDAATHDPDSKNRYLSRYDSGDHLHPNDQGMQAIADATDLKLFD